MCMANTYIFIHKSEHFKVLSYNDNVTLGLYQLTDMGIEEI
jgi:hypothetical protein